MNLRVTLPFAKDPLARPTAGPAVVFGEFASLHGLGRAAAYDLELVRARHSAVTVIDVGPYLKGRLREPFALGECYDNAYFLCQPEAITRLICRLSVAETSPGPIAWAVGVGNAAISQEWRFAERLVHEVWTPSQFAPRTFRDALRPARPGRSPTPSTAPPETGLDIRASLGVPDSRSRVRDHGHLALSRTQEPLGSCARVEKRPSATIPPRSWS